MKITLTALATLILVTSLVACGGDDDDPGGDSNGGSGGDPTANATSNSGSGSVGATPPPSSGDRPSGAGEDFPVPIPDGWVIDVNGSIGLVVTNNIQVLYPLDRFESLVDFYDQWTADEPDEYVRIESDNGIVYQLGSPLRQISVNDDYERDGTQYAVLLISVTG
jgi:hypothetical protein